MVFSTVSFIYFKETAQWEENANRQGGHRRCERVAKGTRQESVDLNELEWQGDQSARAAGAQPYDRSRLATRFVKHCLLVKTI